MDVWHFNIFELWLFNVKMTKVRVLDKEIAVLFAIVSTFKGSLLQKIVLILTVKVLIFRWNATCIEQVFCRGNNLGSIYSIESSFSGAMSLVKWHCKWLPFTFLQRFLIPCSQSAFQFNKRMQFFMSKAAKLHKKVSVTMQKVCSCKMVVKYWRFLVL